MYKVQELSLRKCHRSIVELPLEHTILGSQGKKSSSCIPDLTYQNTYLCLEMPTCITLPHEEWESQIWNVENLLRAVVKPAIIHL